MHNHHNILAKEAGKSNKVTLEILGSNLDRFLTLLVKGSKESLERKIKELRKDLSDTYIKDLFQKLRDLGMDDKKIRDVLSKWRDE